MADVSMDFDVVSQMADGFQTAAETLHAVDRSLEMAIALLQASAFLGMVGNLALARYLEGIQPNVTRLSATCEEMSQDLIGAIAALRDGDYSGSQRFVSGGGSASGGFASDMAGKKQPVLTSRAVSVGSYQDGQNGWELIGMSGEFTPNELLDQGSRPACTIYGAMNLLVENGYDISQTEANAIYQDHIDNPRTIDMWVDMWDGKHEDGFPRGDALEILDDYGADYTHDDFSTWAGLGSPDRAAAERFLIQETQGGNPVYVSAETDDTFGIPDAGHSYTVIGTQTDANGRLTNVLVSTNWGSGSSVYEIPADAFMDDWMAHDGEYVVINK
jgi:hypothetical protein